MSDTAYLWINLTDLGDLGTMGPLGSPINLMIRPELGDAVLPYSVMNPAMVDDDYLIIACQNGRAEAIKDGLIIVSRRKLRHPLRTRITTQEPGVEWKRLAH